MSSLFLEKSEREELINRLNDLLCYMKENFSSYDAYFHEIDGLKLETLDDLCHFPIIDKKEPLALQLASEVLDKNPIAYFETSGTSGNPFPVIPDMSAKRSQEFAHFISEWLDLKNNAITRAAIALPFEMNPIGLKYYLALNQLNIMSIPVGVRTHLCPPRKVLDIFERLRPELLIARPMETLRYAEAMQAQGLDPKQSSIKKIILTGEIISKSKFKRIERIYGGADVYSVYGLTELDSGGLVSCRNHQYHLPSVPYIAIELLKDDFKTPVLGDGEIGNIIFTNTHKNYMPLFRYKTGDYGVLHTQCECGQFKTPVMNLLGRSSDKIDYQGQSVFPIQIEDILFEFDDFASDYQLVKKNDELVLMLELMSNQPNNEEINLLALKLRNAIFNKLNINIEHIHIYSPGRLLNKLGIAKSKAGTLYQLDSHAVSKEDLLQLVQLNFACHDAL
jgi:phenylacetate-coenzyme A ligase PaaK-like adenylate-forming protein